MIKKLRSLKGFSLAEMLIVCAIIAIISAISVGGILSHIKSIRQMKLDTTARTIYTAAQNRLTELYSTGDAELSKLSSDDGSTASFALNEADMLSLDGITPVTEKPSDWGENVEFQDGILYALRSDTASEETKRLFLPYGSVSEESYAKNWIIEFDPADGYVYAVFYSDEKEPAEFYGGKYDSVHDWENLDIIRSGRESRLKNFNATIGYYGGNISVNESYDIDELANSIRVENGEELKAYFNVVVPSKYSNSTTGIDYTVIIEGEISGNKYTYKIENERNGGSRRVAGLRLDSLKKPNNGAVDLSFYSIFCGADIPSSDFVKNYQDLNDDNTNNNFGYAIGTNAVSRTGKLIPGEDIKITFTAAIHNNNTAKQATAVLPHVNSLFASSTHANPENRQLNNNYSNVTARIACGRHLQNLDAETSHINNASNELTVDGRSVNVTIASAVQTADIDLKSSAWTTAYGSRVFTPINNSQLTAYDGGINKTTGETNKIKNMTTGRSVAYDAEGKTPADKVENVADAGLFGTFNGSTLKNITLISARVHSISGNAGALAANISGAAGSKVTVDNCQSYLLAADCDELKASADDADTVITDKAVIYADNGNAGGLIGEAGVGVIISNSSASSVIKSARINDRAYAGGLVGGAEKGIWIVSSYADSYINAVNIGGLVGIISGGISDTASGEINKIIGSYSAGFAVADSNTKVSAGFGITGTGTQGAQPVYMFGSYTVFDTGSDRPTYERYSTLKTTASGDTRRTENVYYTTSESDSTKAIAGTTGVKSADLKKSGTDSYIENMNAVIRREAGSDARLLSFEGGTSAYNLKANLGLTNYEYPHIGGRTHYGDWLDNDIEPGTLVYFEKYSDGTWGFYGGGISTLKNRTTADDHVLQDGYALVYPETGASADIAAEITVTIGDGSDKVSQTLPGITGTTAAGSGYSGSVPIANKGTTSWDKARFRILGSSITDYAAASGNAAGMENFYMPVEVKPVGSSVADYYYFNPHFAKTSVKVASISDENRPSMAGTSDEKHAIYVRTSRQLYLMSRFYTVYAAASSKCVFRQELNIDYASYDWDFDADLRNSLEGNCGGETTVTVDVGSNNTVMVDQSRSQDSIGTEEHPFAAEYNGGCNTITGFSIKTASTQHYAGLFGYVTGSLRNIAFAANYKEKNSSGDILSYGINSSTQVEGIGQTAYIGMLAGCLDNGGEIYNCAAAGYVINGYAYDYSNINAGGLVGLNRGYISNSSADIPVINVHTNGGSNANIGGFVGSNENDIKDCYGIGFINAGRSASDKIGRVYLAGFAGYNIGDVEGSYCATTFISENIDTDRLGGFTQSGRGNVTRCLYLDGGSYYYIDKVRSYNVDSEGDSTKHVGKAATNSDFISLLNADISSSISMNDLSDAYGKAAVSSYHPHTNTADDIYPYPAIVEDAAGNKVHYGEWVIDSSLAETGFVYWEKETGGSNKGYHFYIIDAKNEEHSTLCTAHDDGGVITEYGYGFFYSLGIENGSGKGTKVSATWNNVNIGAAGFTNAEENKDAEKVLGKQFSSVYQFVLYRTTEVSDKNGTTSHDREDKGMFLTDQTFNDGGNDLTAGGAYAVCTLTVDNTASTDITVGMQYRYVFAPFFGKSMILESVSETKGTGSSLTSTGIAYPGTDDGDSFDTAKKDYDRYGGALTPMGTAAVKDYQKYGLPFEIRSTAQLQYINWRTDTFDATTEAIYTDADSLKDDEYFYGGYKSDFYAWAQTDHYKYLKWYAYNLDASKGEIPDNGNYNYYWKQTHDVNGSGKNFTPIGCLNDIKQNVENWTSGTNSMPFISYFNGDYNGDSYKIQNINISSYAQTVGLFGVTVSARLRNIILYSSANNIIETKTQNYRSTQREVVSNNRTVIKNVPEEDKAFKGINWYCLGGLAGFAGKGTIENCAVSGYTIRDGRTKSGAGDANVGGFVGFCATSINNCASVNDVVIATRYTFEKSATEGNVESRQIHVGGMVGICPSKIMNSYCGGSIQSIATTGSDAKTSVYIGGIMGGEWFKGQGLSNLTGIMSFEYDSDKIKPELDNCYSYVKLPDSKAGEVKTINVMATTADLDESVRGLYSATPSTVIIRNCYYYKTYATIANIAPHQVKSNPYREDVYYIDENGNPITWNYAARMGLDYRTMADTVSDNGLLKLLNKGDNAFGTVTVTENGGANINGKYSFPGSDAELTGKNYPFPTVITQADPFKPDDKTAKVNVHYGQWVKGTGIFADSTIVALDLLSQTSADDGSMVPDDEQTVNIRYYNESSLDDLNTQPVIAFGTGTAAATESDKVRCTWTKVDRTSTEPAYWKLTVTGLKEGYETITLTDSTHTDPTTGRPCTTRINVSITADMTIRITAQGTVTDLVAGSSVSYKLELLDRNNSIVAATAANWRAVTTDVLIAESDGITGGTATSPDILLKVNGYKVGKTQLTVTATGIASRNGGILPDKSYTADVRVVNPASGMSAVFYVDGDSISADDGSSVVLDYGQAPSDDASELAKFNMITDKAVSDPDVNGGRVFAGWITEDGTKVDADTKLYSPLTLNAAWKCTELIFCDTDVYGRYAERGRLYYNNGVYYTDNTLSERAETAPLPFADKSGLVFNGYWTKPSGGERVALGDRSLILGALSDIGGSEFVPSVKLYTHWDEVYEPFNTLDDSAAAPSVDGQSEDGISEVSDTEPDDADMSVADDPETLDTEDEAAYDEQ